MRHRGHVGDQIDTDPECSQGANRRFTAGAWTFDFNVKVFDALFNSSTASNFGSNLSCKRG